MGLVITPQSEIDKYFESDALSQSNLKKLLGGIDSFINNQKEESELFYTEKGHFIIGSAVDTILTGVEGEFENKYHVSVLEKKPSDTEMSIINRAFQDILDSYSEEQLKEQGIDELSKYPGSIQMAIEEHNYQPNWKTETKINKIVENGTLYFEDLKKAVGKQMLSSNEMVLISSIVSSLKTNPRTSKYFDRDALLRADKVTVYYQLPIYFTYKGVKCKALLDMLIVIRDEAGKVVSVQAFDLKTMNGNTLKFPSNLKSFRYDIQAAWYTEAIFAKDSTLKIDGLTPEILRPFTFIVESNSQPGIPLLYEIDGELLLTGKFGRPDLILQGKNENQVDVLEILKQKVVGFDELIDTYIYQSNNDWKEEKIITDNNGVLKIGWNGIK